MKRRSLFLASLSASLMAALPLSAQVSVLPAQEVVEPTVSSIADPIQSTAPITTVSVNQAPSFLNTLQQQQWVVLDNNGTIHGLYAQLNPDGSPRMLERVAVSLSRNGVLIKTAMTESDGHFAFSGLGVGTYALIAKSPASTAAFALHVLPNGASSRLDANFIVFGTSVGVPAVTGVLRAHSVPVANSEGFYPDLQSDPAGDTRRVNAGAQVRLRAGNVLVGKISRPSGMGMGAGDLSGNVVHVMSGGRVVGHTETDANGEYQIPGIAPGVYDLVIAGKDGVAAAAFVAVADPGVALKGTGSAKLVSFQPGAMPDSLNLEVVSPSDYFSGEPEQVFPPEEVGMAPVPGAGFVGPGGFAGGGAGGGFGGGGAAGGGGGGFGGLGALLGIGGLAAGIAALASSNNNGVGPPFASP